MAEPIEQLITKDHEYYNNLIKGGKLLKQDRFCLSTGSGPKKDWNLGDLQLIHDCGLDGNLVTEQSKNKLSKYRVILFIKSYSLQPLCRFDSDGRYHENIISTVPLVKRKVSTPHFHEYNKDGVMFAFKTENLLINEKRIKENIQNGIEEMCYIYNITSPKNSGLKYITQSPLFPTINIEDTHEDIFFPV